MKLFEIIFILLILLPMALMMRYFISKLSSEKPRQRRSAEEDMKWDNPLKGRFKRRKKNPEKRKKSPENKSTGQQEAPRKRPGRQTAPAQNTPNGSYRRPAELKRTQRIPFSELYGQMEAGSDAHYQAENTGSVSDSVAQRVSARRAAAKNAPRSEKEPSKREKRRNRERARKRELARRDKDNN